MAFGGFAVDTSDVAPAENATDASWVTTERWNLREAFAAGLSETFRARTFEGSSDTATHRLEERS